MSEAKTATSTELAVVNAANAVDIFTKGGLAAILDGIESKVRAMPLDESTAAGRDEIRSVAYKVVRTKTALDTEAKKLTEGWRAATSQVNAERKVAQDRLDALAEEVRAPLTAFENKEKIRIAGHESAMSEMSGLYAMLRAYPNMEVSLLEDHQRDFAALNALRKWEEFATRAAKLRAEVDAYLNERITARQQFDAERAELLRLRQEEAERQIREREQRAAEAARLEAERKAKDAADAEARRVIEAANREQERVRAEAERVRMEAERAQREAEAKAKAEALAIEQKRIAEQNARLDAERRLREAEEARIAAEIKAEADRIAAERKAAEDLKAAIERERAMAEAKRKAEDDERLKREANEKNRSKVRAEILEDIAIFGKVANAPEAIITAIMDGKVRHVKVAF